MTLTAPISTIMTRDVHTLELSAKLSEVRRALITNEFHHMPIVDDDRLVGMISWRDLVRAYRKAHSPDVPDPFGIDEALDKSSRIEDAMTRELVTVRDDDSIDRAIDLIADAHVHSVLVLDSDRRLVGIVTDKDIVDYLRG
jgi:CBS-domain-containing membrane protein